MGFRLIVAVLSESSRVECYVRFRKDSENRSKLAFEKLFAQREAIERSFGGKLDWQALPQRIGSRVCMEIPGGWRLPQERWPELQDALIDGTEKLANALREPIRDLGF